MVTAGLLVHIEAKPGQEAAAKTFLKSILPLAEDESGTVSWHAYQTGPATFTMFSSFEDERGQETHLNGNIAIALAEEGPALFVQPPTVQRVAVIGAKLPSDFIGQVH